MQKLFFNIIFFGTHYLFKKNIFLKGININSDTAKKKEYHIIEKDDEFHDCKSSFEKEPESDYYSECNICDSDKCLCNATTYNTESFKQKKINDTEKQSNIEINDLEKNYYKISTGETETSSIDLMNEDVNPNETEHMKLIETPENDDGYNSLDLLEMNFNDNQKKTKFDSSYTNKTKKKPTSNINKIISQKQKSDLLNILKNQIQSFDEIEFTEKELNSADEDFNILYDSLNLDEISTIKKEVNNQNFKNLSEKDENNEKGDIIFSDRNQINLDSGENLDVEKFKNFCNNVNLFNRSYLDENNFKILINNILEDLFEIDDYLKNQNYEKIDELMFKYEDEIAKIIEYSENLKNKTIKKPHINTSGKPENNKTHLSGVKSLKNIFENPNLNNVFNRQQSFSYLNESKTQEKSLENQKFILVNISDPVDSRINENPEKSSIL